jgi:hypothetical protein
MNKLFSFERITLIVSIVACALATGCATFDRTKPAPNQPLPVSVAVTDEEMSGWSDLPPGVYRVPDSQVIVSGHQKGSVAGILFGVVGVAFQSAVNSGVGKSATADAETALKIKIIEPARVLLDALLRKPEYQKVFTAKDIAKSPKISITASVAFVFVDDARAQPYVVLKAELRGMESSNPVWMTRYIGSSGEPRALLGDNSWTSDGGAALRSTVELNLDRVFEFMLADMASPYLRDESNMFVVESNFPYVKPRLEVLGYKLAEDDSSIAFLTKVGDVVVFSGVNLLDKRTVKIRTAKKDDPNFKLAEPAK